MKEIAESDEISDEEKGLLMGSLWQDIEKEAHNNECGFLVCANIVGMVKGGINCKLHEFNSSQFIDGQNSIRDLFQEAYRKIVKRSSESTIPTTSVFIREDVDYEMMAGAGRLIGSRG